jgi:hypothetical protein
LAGAGHLRGVYTLEPRLGKRQEEAGGAVLFTRKSTER